MNIYLKLNRLLLLIKNSGRLKSRMIQLEKLELLQL